jgi:predicted dehydrogenase
MAQLRIAIIGCGSITLQNHLPGFALCPETRVVALCDSDPGVLERARQATGMAMTTTRYEELIARDDVDAVVIATPNVMHAPIALAAFRAGKHVLCEKPIAMNAAEAWSMVTAAEQAKVRHMTAFTYRFVPAMRYLAAQVGAGALGQLYHFRSCRLQDWGARPLGWRQRAAMAGSGELGDMLSHRIDFALSLTGEMTHLAAATRRFVDQRGGQESDLDDWVSLLAEFRNGATGVLESSKLATGRSESWRSQDYVELNGSHGSFVFFTERWNELMLGRPGGSGLETIPIPGSYWKLPNAPRDVHQGDPLVTFRYDQAFEFVDAIRSQRPCLPSLVEGARVQSVMDAALCAARERRWVAIDEFQKGLQP